jgi:proteasome lid subunit RPN8/RPN11
MGGTKVDKEIFIKQKVVDSILSYAQMCHPRESILLLKGKNEKKKITLEDVQIPPLSTHARAFSSFPLYMLPMDFSIMGVAHSHPSGALRPSIVDLNKFYGRIMLITGYPYQTEQNIKIFDRNGQPRKFGVIE